MTNHFPREKRLTSSQEYRQTLRSSRREHCNGIILCAYKNNLTSPRLGLVIAKREIPKAVNRNRFKRLIREGFRLNQNRLGGYDIVIMVKRKCLKKTKEDITNILNRLWPKFYSS